MKLFSLIIAIILAINLEAEAIRVGVVAPLSGGASNNGLSIANAIRLADQKYDSNNQVEFIFEDDQLKPKLTVAAVNKLILVDKVSALIVFGSPTSLAVNDIAEKNKVPMIAMSIVERVVEDKQYVVKHWVTALAENQALKKELDQRNYQSIAIVATQNDAMLRLKDLCTDNDLPVVFSEEVTPEELDFKAIALKVKNAQPDAVYNLLWAPQPGVFAKMLRQVGYQGDIY